MTTSLTNKIYEWVKSKAIEPIQARNYIKDSNRFTKEEKEALLFKINVLERLIK
jgi:hypothetical protein